MLLLASICSNTDTCKFLLGLEDENVYMKQRELRARFSKLQGEEVFDKIVCKFSSMHECTIMGSLV